MNGPETVRLSLPESLRNQLLEFRKRVWTVKSIEALAIALLGFLLAFLVVYCMDRFFDTPRQLRGMLLLVALLVGCVVPWACYRWIWKRRRLDQLAMLLRYRHPSVGDQLLGIIELVDNEQEQARSLELCSAAVEQVAEDAKSRDLVNAIPQARHVLFGRLAAAGLLVALVLLALSPAATANAWIRYLMPWHDTPRYTFTMIDGLPNNHVVPHGEVFPLTLRLKEQTRWKPETAQIQFDGGQPIQTRLDGDHYVFDCPPQLAETSLRIKIGDYFQRVSISPTGRPELTDVMAEIELPRYLQRTENLRKDMRSGVGTFVIGSKAKIQATASRPLKTAALNGGPLDVEKEVLQSDWVSVDAHQQLSIQWQDNLGLAGQKPFKLTLNSRDDEAPSIVCEGLPRQRVVLDSENLPFQVRCVDDFGIRRVGIEWKGLDTTMSSPAVGERLLGAGSATSEELNLNGTFCAKTLGIAPQPVQVRMFAEDYLPDRERVYSPVYTLYVLSPEDHAIWMTDQLSKWHQAFVGGA